MDFRKQDVTAASMFVLVLMSFFDSKIVAFRQIFASKSGYKQEVREKVKKDQSTIYCGINISLPHFVVFFLYKGKIFC